ncbi:MAG: hypothetical protein O3A53_02115 [Acidobacteria bacterium]|nr:hypothetical protein [Acidobacteriota bacterium]MDA1233576.1 hypothetical protein [Acidobacteriota bacterium]
MPFKNALTSYRNLIGSALTLFVVLLGATTHLDAKPFIFYRGVVHAASFAPPGSPAGVIPQGGLFSIFGKEIGPAEAAQVTAFPLGAELAGVGLTVTQDDTVVDAIPVFVRAGQVNVIMPSDAPLGEVSIRVTFNGETSNPVRVTVVAHGPGIFTANQFGIGPGIVQNFIAADNRPTNSNRVTAQRGQLVTIWLTGLGAIEGADNQAPTVGTLPYEVEVFFGGVKATQIDYAGRAPCCSAVDQVNALIPLETPTGCFVSLTVRVNGAVSNTVTMAIGEDPAACADPHNPFSETLVSGGKQGNVVLLRQEFLDETVGARPFEHTLDVFSAQFTDYPGGPFAFNPNNSLPPPGSCTSYTFQGDILEDATVAATASGALTAGSIAVTTPAGVVQATAIPPAMTLYAALLGHTIDIVDFPTVPLKLEPGGATVTANGGDVGAFEADVTITAPVTWTNRAALDSINRANGVRFEWQGEAQVILAGMSTEMASNSSGVFLCVASPGATSFDVPDYALTNLPRSRFTRAQTRAYLLLLSMPPNQPTEFEADGLDYGGAVVIHAQMLGTVVR